MNILKEDQSSQCKVMLKVTVRGQLAAENLDDVRQKYKRMSRIVWCNMKIREQMLSTVNSQVKDLWTYAQSLVRVEVNKTTLITNKNSIELLVSLYGKNRRKDFYEDICNKILAKNIYVN